MNDFCYNVDVFQKSSMLYHCESNMVCDTLRTTVQWEWVGNVGGEKWTTREGEDFYSQLPFS